MHTDRRKVIGRMQRSSGAADLSRYVAPASGRNAIASISRVIVISWLFFCLAILRKACTTGGKGIDRWADVLHKGRICCS
ncbi:MAG: hypothetical protein KME54_17145 [Tolypothrix brevis GSE-NOS-MK-07-07A]|jgi:hypothetical protein|nr:hypothetical protein [Tolypothrix brevis GSE-NOS-MK-07-07A]